MSDVRWEPVENGHSIDGDWTEADRRPPLEYHDNEDGRYFVATLPGEYSLDDDIRLCRAVAAPTWSQEPPTEPGDWWVWHRSEEVRRAKVRQADIAGFWRVIFDDGDFALMNKNKNWLGYWWMPATVPQPPTREVGP